MTAHTHPVEVKQEGGEDGQRPAAGPAYEAEPQNQEELRPRSEGAAVPGHRRPAWETEELIFYNNVIIIVKN